MFLIILFFIFFMNYKNVKFLAWEQKTLAHKFCVIRLNGIDRQLSADLTCKQIQEIVNEMYGIP